VGTGQAERHPRPSPAQPGIETAVIVLVATDFAGQNKYPRSFNFLSIFIIIVGLIRVVIGGAVRGKHGVRGRMESPFD